MTFDLDRYAEELLDGLEELPFVSRDRWQAACSNLESTGCDSSILDEFARPDEEPCDE